MRTSLKKLSVFISLFVALTVLLSAVPMSYAATSVTVNKKVYLTKASYVQLTDASLIPSTKGATASFTFTLYNGDSSAINLVDYWARLKSKSGTSYTLTLLDKDSKKTVSPKSSTTLTYYSEVSSNVKLEQLILNFIKFDFSVAGYERTIGQFTFPAGYSNYVKAGGYKGIKISNSNVNIRIDQINVSKTADSYSINLSYLARNTSQFGVTLPEYSYYIQTSKGLFQLKLKNTSDQNSTLEPTVLNSIRLYGSIPSTLSTTGWKLIVTQKTGSSDTSQVELPVVTFEIPVKINNTTSAKKTFTDDNGTYDVELQSVQRLPSDNDDNIVAKLLVTNKESVYLPLPDLSGTMVVDENINLTSQTIKNTADIGLAPGASTTITFIGNLPYSYEWSKFELELSEKSGDDTVQVAEVVKSDLTSIYSVQSGSVYTQKSNGSQMSAVITDVRTYSGDTNDIYAVYMDVTNNQTRSNVLPLFTGYFKSASGNYYEAKVVKSSKAISPSNKDQIIIYTELPQSVSKEGLQLLLGEAYDATGLLKGSEGTPTGFLRAVLFGLPMETVMTSNYENLKVGPYNVDLDYFNVFIKDGSSLEIDMGGNISRDYSYDAFSQSKLLFELEYEQTDEVLWSQVVDLEGKSDGSIKWKIGDNYNSISKTLDKSKFWSTYTLNVYDTFSGNKKLLFSKEVKFSSIINWLDGEQ